MSTVAFNSIPIYYNPSQKLFSKPFNVARAIKTHAQATQCLIKGEYEQAKRLLVSLGRLVRHHVVMNLDMANVLDKRFFALKSEQKIKGLEEFHTTLLVILAAQQLNTVTASETLSPVSEEESLGSASNSMAGIVLEGLAEV